MRERPGLSRSIRPSRVSFFSLSAATQKYSLFVWKRSIFYTHLVLLYDGVEALSLSLFVSQAGKPYPGNEVNCEKYLWRVSCFSHLNVRFSSRDFISKMSLRGRRLIKGSLTYYLFFKHSKVTIYIFK